jgi:hypothetical protein
VVGLDNTGLKPAMKAESCNALFLAHGLASDLQASPAGGINATSVAADAIRFSKCLSVQNRNQPIVDVRRPKSVALENVFGSERTVLF